MPVGVYLLHVIVLHNIRPWPGGQLEAIVEERGQSAPGRVQLRMYEKVNDAPNASMI